MNTLFTLKTQHGEMHVKPENIAKMQKHIHSKPKAYKPKADKRIFPKHSHHLQSTLTYVNAYLSMNGLLIDQYGRGIFNLSDFHLSSGPTVWPDPALDTVEYEDAE